jgi:hypothetical protein
MTRAGKDDLWRAHASYAGCMPSLRLGRIWGWIGAGLLSINLSIGVAGLLKLDAFSARFADASALIRAAAFLAFVFHAFHAIRSVIVVVATKTRSPSSAPTWPFVMPRQSVATRKSPPTFIASMRALSGVQFGMSL